MALTDVPLPDHPHLDDDLARRLSLPLRILSGITAGSPGGLFQIQLNPENT